MLQTVHMEHHRHLWLPQPSHNNGHHRSHDLFDRLQSQPHGILLQNLLLITYKRDSPMKNDSREKWCKKGELFHKYRPRETADESKPSEWWILVYLLQRVLDVVLFRKREPREKGAEKGRKWPMLWNSGRQGERDRAAQVDEAGDAQA